MLIEKQSKGISWPQSYGYYCSKQPLYMQYKEAERLVLEEEKWSSTVPYTSYSVEHSRSEVTKNKFARFLASPAE